VKDLAWAVKLHLPDTHVSMNPHAAPDKRSYRVNFDLFKRLAPDHQPLFTLPDTIEGLVNGLKQIKFSDDNFRSSELIRLNVIRKLLAQKEIDTQLGLVLK
jgi:hypothetical protein